MKRAHGLVAICGLSLTLSAAMAVPPVVERVPDDALITLVIPSPTQLHKNLQALSTAVDSPFPVMSVEDILAMGGMGGGIDTTKSLAVVMYGPKDLEKLGAKSDKPEKGDAKGDKDKDKGDKKDAKAKDDDEDDEAALEEGLDRAVVLIPITKYEEFLGNFNAKPAGEGKVDSFATPQGEDAYSKNLGDGYAVMGSVKELVEKFSGKPGASSVKSRMSKAGEQLADSSDLVAIVNMDRLRPMAEKGLAKMEKQAKEQMEAVGQESTKNLEMVRWIGDTFVRDTQMLVGGLKTGSMGVSMDMVGSFKPDSYMAKAFAAKGAASALLGKLPAGAYLWAGAIDLNAPGARQMMKDIVSRADMPGGPEASRLAAQNMDNVTGQAAVVGFPVGGAFAGIFTNTVLFTAAKDPTQALKSVKETLAAMNGQKVSELTYKTTYTENATKVGDVSVDKWETKFEAENGEMPAAMQQAMPFLFGPQGMPVGYVAKTDGGLYTTYALNSELVQKALGAGKGENLASDPMLKQSQDLLPKDRMAEMYIGTKGLLDLGLPFAAMAGVTVPADKVPEKLPPIAGAISAQEGAMRASMVIPAPVLKTGFTLYSEFEKAQAAGENAKPKPEKGAGQPKF